MFADGEVLRFDLLLRALDGLADHPVLDRHAFFHAEPLHQAGDAIRAEDAHQIVLQREIETPNPPDDHVTQDRPHFGVFAIGLGRKRHVAEAPAPVLATERRHFSAMLMKYQKLRLVDEYVARADDTVKRVEMEEIGVLLVLDEALFAFGQPLGDLFREALLPRHELRIAAEQNVGAAAGHVGRDRHGAFPPRLRDELRFLRVILRVEHDVLVGAAAGRRPALQPAAIEHRRQLF